MRLHGRITIVTIDIDSHARYAAATLSALPLLAAPFLLPLGRHAAFSADTPLMLRCRYAITPSPASRHCQDAEAATGC